MCYTYLPERLKIEQPSTNAILERIRHWKTIDPVIPIVFVCASLPDPPNSSLHIHTHALSET